jgi:hypothetical protein
MNRRQVGGTVLATVATGVVALAVAKIVQNRRLGVDPSDEELKWIRELLGRLKDAEGISSTGQSAILSEAYRGLRAKSNVITSKQLRRRLNRLLKVDPTLLDETLIDLERLLEDLEAAVERRSM